MVYAQPKNSLMPSNEQESSSEWANVRTHKRERNQKLRGRRSEFLIERAQVISY